MHLIPTIPGGWNPNNEGVFYIEQKPGDIVFLSAADTEIHSLNSAYKDLHNKLDDEEKVTLPSLRMANLVYLKHELTIDKYVEEVVGKAKVIICRLLGGISYYPYLCEAIINTCKENKTPLIFLPGYSAPDIELLNNSTVNPNTADMVWKYFCAGGKDNYINCFKYLFNTFFNLNYSWNPPQAIPDLFLFHSEKGILQGRDYNMVFNKEKPSVAIIVYLAHYLSDNLEPVYHLSKELSKRDYNPIIVFVNNLRDKNVTEEIYALVTNNETREIDVIINTTSFSIKSLNEEEDNFIFSKLNVPVLQAIFASCTKEVWQENFFGLTPTDIAINIALPEIDGRIITKAISFKASLGKDLLTDSDIIKYSANKEGCDFVIDFVEKWVSLRKKNNQEKRIALIMPNYPNKDSRLANGVGLDTPESCVNILKALKETTFHTGDFIPASSSELMQLLTHYITNDTDTTLYRPYQVSLSESDFNLFYNYLNEDLKQKIEQQWGTPKDSPNYDAGKFIIPGFLLGNIFVSIQPSRGYHDDPKAIYHSPDLPPTFAYLAYYFWVCKVFQADAVIHIGKHGNLEWLPGKSVALSKDSCFPAALLDAIPHFYPFIVNDPGEGTQAKRRNQAIIIDHLIPAMTRAESYGALTKLEHLIDEYYEAFNTDPKRTSVVKAQIKSLVKETNLDSDLNASANDIDELLIKVDAYLCELKEAQIRDGLHILGEAPKDEQLIDLIIALHRLPTSNLPGITQALAKDLSLSFDPLNCDYSTPFNQDINNIYCRSLGDVVEQLELIIRKEIKDILTENSKPFNAHKISFSDFIKNYTSTTEVLNFIFKYTFPKILQTENEILNLLKGLSGKYVPSGGSGAPTRGNLEVLPTGRNFYSVDVRSIPTQIAYLLGVKSANLIIERYLQENGDYPETIGLSVWGTSTMRTGGDDIAQAFALMGVKPIWQSANRRVADFEVIPLFLLKRPRIDVTLRISGFFRDAFPDIISLFNTVIERLALLVEPIDQNPIRKKYLLEKEEWQNKGIHEDKAHKRALFRVFGSKPGAYGAGLQAVIDEKNWKTREDLAKVYIQWSGYAYGQDRTGESAHEVFEKRLSDIQIVMHNQDNREHDILDSDDYYQFQGGMANAVNTVKGEVPSIYFGDHSRPETPRVKTLKEELLKVYRSRVVNPKWIEGIKRHGYKGAFEMAATMDYLFAYDATTDLIEDFMYEGITESYLFNEENRNFIEQVNPWALKDMTERMLEAIQRGMWKNPKEETVKKLENIFLNCE